MSLHFHYSSSHPPERVTLDDAIIIIIVPLELDVVMYRTRCSAAHNGTISPLFVLVDKDDLQSREQVVADWRQQVVTFLKMKIGWHHALYGKEADKFPNVVMLEQGFVRSPVGRDHPR